MDEDQAGQNEDAHITRLAVICVAMEAKDLQNVTEAENKMRQEDALKRLSEEWVELFNPLDPKSEWMGEEVYNAYPIQYSVRNNNPISLQKGAPVM